MVLAGLTASAAWVFLAMLTVRKGRRCLLPDGIRAVSPMSAPIITAGGAQTMVASLRIRRTRTIGIIVENLPGRQYQRCSDHE